MSTKNLARAISQGGHDANYNLRVRTYHRRSRREARRFVGAMLADGMGDAHVAVEHVNWGYAGKKATGSGGPLRRWLGAMVGRDFEEAYHRLCGHDRRSRRGRELVKRALDLIEDVSDDASVMLDDDITVDLGGTLHRGSDFASSRGRSSRPAAYLPMRRAVVDRCGELFWKCKDGALVAMSAEQAETFHLLPGSRQRRLKGYHRTMDGKRRKNRTP